MQGSLQPFSQREANPKLKSEDECELYSDVERKNSEEKSQEKFGKISCNHDSNNFCLVPLKAFFYKLLYKYPGRFGRLILFLIRS